MTKLEVFLAQVDFAGKSKLSKEVVLVTVNRAKKSWNLNFIFDDFLLPTEVKEFFEKVESFLHTDDIGDFSVSISYNSKDYNKIDMIDYYDFVLDDLVKEKGRLMMLKGLRVDFSDNVYYIDAPKSIVNFGLYSREIEKHFKKYGFDVSCEVKINEDLTSIEEALDKKETESIIAYKEQTPKTKEVVIAKRKKIGNIKSRIEPISNIPSDKLGLSDYENTVGPLYFVVAGEIFSFDSRKMRNSFLYSIKITDDSDSILIKRFANTAKEIETLNELKVGSYIKVAGKVEFDAFERDVVLKADEIASIDKPKKDSRKDDSDDKRVELHAHTIMSNMDSVATVGEYLDTVEKWGHKAIAFTDHDGVYCFPDVLHELKGRDIKPIYGAEVSLVNDKEFKIAFNQKDINLDSATYVVFDIETTGFSTEYDDIIEIGAWKYRDGARIQDYQRFISVDRKLTKKISTLTNITDEMLNKDGKDEDFVIKEFFEFIQDSILVAHNASFDIGHIYSKFKKHNISFEEFPVIDTMQLARSLHFDEMKHFNLDALTKFYKVKLENHHRADDDALATAEAFKLMLIELKKLGIDNYQDINKVIREDAWKGMFGKHITILARNQVGYKNLFKVISDSLTTHLYKKPRVVKEFLDSHREGLLIGSSCVNGEIFETALNKPYEDLLSKMDYYDYIEVQPPSVYAHLKVEASVDGDYLIENTIKKIIKAAKEKGKTVVATGDVHYINPEDQKYRDIYLRTPVVGGGRHSLVDYPGVTKQYLRTTKEMLDEFKFLGNVEAYNIVVVNTNRIADMIEHIEVFPKGLFAPSDDEFKDSLNVPSIENALKEMVEKNVHAMYGEVLPQIVEERLNKELNSIITHKFSSVYYMSHLLVKKSLDDGYLVGSRGSVGSSFVATMMNITEVNPLSPHYRCQRCRFSSFKMNEEEKKKYGIRNIEIDLQENLNLVDDGYDLPDAICPICGTPLKKDGHDIPFETFLGFKGDKVPDIDLNFSGEYQGKAHEYIRSVMGYDYAFRAGTLSTVAEKTAYGYVKGYLEDNRVIMRKAEIERIAKKIEGVKRSSGQHPGGIVVVPSKIEIYDVTPIQYPADDPTNNFRTTHFDYHSFESNLLKLDILGHDDPTLIKYLMDYVKMHPNDFPFNRAQDIPVDDKEVLKLFSGTEVLNVTKEEIRSEVASFAIPELGTDFVRQMLVDTKPKTFAELVKISGLSHGTDVWLNNAKSLVSGEKEEYGKVDFKKIIGCRDDIMVDLMYQGLEPAKAFEIMEFVRRGKPSKDKEKWNGYIDYMRKYSVPEWYIWSCGQIKYMFPKAHATAYILMALRIAWFKVHKPLLFYAGFFSKRVDTFDIEVMCGDANRIRNRIDDLVNGHYDTDELSKQKADDQVTTLLIALEMVSRNFKFKMADINKSLASEFVMVEEENALLFPFIAIDGLGSNVAINIVEVRNEKEFSSKQDLQKRAKINKTVYERMEKFGVLKDLGDAEDNDEYTLFAIMD